VFARKKQNKTKMTKQFSKNGAICEFSLSSTPYTYRLRMRGMMESE